MNRCAEIKALLLPYLHGEAARSERALVHAHLAACRGCQSELEALQQAEGALHRSLNAHAAESAPPAQAWMRLQSALLPQPQPSPLLRPGGWLAQLGGALRRAAPAFTATVIMAVGLQTFFKSPQVIGIPESTPGAMMATDTAAPLHANAPPIQQERTSDALVVSAGSPDMSDLADLTDRNLRVRAPQRLVAPRTLRRSYLLPPISGELIEDGVRIRPCGGCGQEDPAPQLPVSLPVVAQPATLASGSRSFDCVECAAQR